MEPVSLPSLIRATIKRHIKWYSIPFIYFLLTSLLCAYAWYTRPIPHRPAIKAVFKIISLNPTLILTGIITVWIIVVIILITLRFWLKKRLPASSFYTKSASISETEGTLQEQSSDKMRSVFWRKTINISVSVLGIILIFTGISLAAWIYRPYITFLFSTSKIEALEEKAANLGQIQSNDTETTVPEISEQSQKDKIKKNTVSEETAQSLEQKEKDHIKQHEAVDITTEERSKPEEDKTGVVSTRDRIRKTVEKMRGTVTRKSEALKNKAEGIAQSKENRIIIPTALIDAPILEGIDVEKLSEGVCHISESTAPGQGGNCIIEGHNLGEFGWWRPQGPFNMLEILEQGIRIYVFYNGKKYIYRVKEKRYTDINDPNLYDFSPGERLTLITCTTTWNPHVYTDKRTVIVAYPE